MAYRYEETIPFHPAVRLLYLAMLAVLFWSVLKGGIAFPDLAGLLLVSAVLVALPLLFGRFVIQVDEETLSATWGYLGWPKQVIPLSEIEKAEVVSYKPLRQFGGWGIRCGRIDGQSTGCYTLRGNQGLLLTLNRDRRICTIRTRRFLLGSQQAEALQQALDRRA